MLHLETQLSAQVTYRDPGKQENHHRCFLIQRDQLITLNIIHTIGGMKTTQDPISGQMGRDGDGTRLANVGGRRPTPLTSPRDSGQLPWTAGLLTHLHLSVLSLSHATKMKSIQAMKLPLSWEHAMAVPLLLKYCLTSTWAQ